MRSEHPAIKGWILVEDNGKVKRYRHPEDHRRFRLLVDPQETLSPNSDVVVLWHYSSEPTHYEAVDDPPANPDEDATFICTDPDSERPNLDIFGLPATTIPPDATINYVRVYNRTRRASDPAVGRSRTVLRTYGTDYYGAFYTPTKTYSDRYTEYATNPYTGNPWTIDELNALEIGVYGISGVVCLFFTALYAYYEVFCTQVYALIDYTVGVAYVVDVTDVAKTADYIQKSPLKGLRDTVKTQEYVRKYSVKVFLDWSVGEYSVIKFKGYRREFLDVVRTTDFYSKAVEKALADIGIPCDWVAKDVRRALVDVGIPCDWVAKDVSKRVEFEAPTTDWAERIKGYVREFVDVCRAVDWRGAFDIAKSFRDYVVARDAPYRVITIVLMDSSVGEFYVSKGMSPAVREVSRMKDVLTKVAYRLAGFDVRRVYFHRVWGDIIEPKDQNVKIQVAEVLLKAMKRVREKLEE